MVSRATPCAGILTLSVSGSRPRSLLFQTSCPCTRSWNPSSPSGTSASASLARDAARVLIDSDDRRVRQQGSGRWRHGGEIVAGKERCRKQSPKTHVRPIFLLVHAAIADLEHVGIVPMSRAGIARDIDLTEAYGRHAEVAVGNVLGGTPEVAAHRGAPLPDIVLAILTQAVDDGPAGLEKRCVHLLIRLDHHLMSRG